MLNGCSELENEVTSDGGLITHRNRDFMLGKGERIKLNDRNEIILNDNVIEGKYFSPVIKVSKFKQLVSSWNVDTPEDTEIELAYKVRVNGKWSMWFSYGKWSSEGNRGSISNQRDSIANMSIDTVEVLYGKEADAFKYSIVLTRKNIDIDSPKIKTVFTALKLYEEKNSSSAVNKNWLVELDVPERSQMIVPKIGNSICSPTSLSMVMEYYGENVDTEKVAEHVLDKNADIYGNWSYNVAYAGSRGFTSYVAYYTSIDEIKDKISNGIPVIVSIKTKSKNTLAGAPMTYPSGHLIVIRGFKIKNGDEYVIVNDPAAPDNDTVRREYKLSQFERAWNKVVYILFPYR